MCFYVPQTQYYLSQLKRCASKVDGLRKSVLEFFIHILRTFLEKKTFLYLRNAPSIANYVRKSDNRTFGAIFNGTNHLVVDARGYCVAYLITPESQSHCLYGMVSHVFVRRANPVSVSRKVGSNMFYMVKYQHVAVPLCYAVASTRADPCQFVQSPYTKLDASQIINPSRQRYRRLPSLLLTYLRAYRIFIFPDRCGFQRP